MSFLKWLGGKGMIASDLAKTVCKGKYVEPFLGGGSVMLEVLTNGYKGTVIVNDLNKDLIDVWLDVRDHCEELCQEILDMGEKITEDKYYILRDEYNTSDHTIRRSALFIVLNRACFRGLYRVNSMGVFNVPFGNYKKVRVPINLIRLASKLIQGVIITCMDYRDFVEKYVDQDTFVYFDPPYLGTYDQYTKNKFDDDEFKEVVKNVCSKAGVVWCSNMSNWGCETFKNKYVINVQNRINSKNPGEWRAEALFY